MAVRFAKMDADLDSHPKVRKAGRVGREVFLFVLRRNAALDRSGRVPSTYVEPWYLADQLMMSEDEACHGLSRTVTAGLLTVTDGHVSICGWSDEWAKAPLDEAERKRREREKKKAAEVAVTVTGTSDDESRDVTDSHGRDVTESDCPDSHALDKKRVEEKREEEEPAPAGALPTLKAKADKAPRQPSKGPYPTDWVPSDTHRSKALDLRIDLTHEAEAFRNHHIANGSRFANWDAAFHGWLSKSAKWRDERGGPRGAAQSEIRTNLQPL